MATKPSILPRWADVGGDIVEPISGKKDIGFIPGERAPAQTFNWLHNVIFQWTDYLDDGDLVGDHSITGNLTITTSIVKRSPRWRNIPVCNLLGIAGVTSRGTQYGYLGTIDAAAVMVACIDVDAGERIVGAKIRYNPNNASDTVRARLYRVNNTGNGPSRTQIGNSSDGVADATNDNRTVVISGTVSETVPADSMYSYFIEVAPLVFNSGFNLVAAMVQTDVP